MKPAAFSPPALLNRILPPLLVSGFVPFHDICGSLRLVNKNVHTLINRDSLPHCWTQIVAAIDSMNTLNVLVDLWNEQRHCHSCGYPRLQDSVNPSLTNNGDHSCPLFHTHAQLLFPNPVTTAAPGDPRLLPDTFARLNPCEQAVAMLTFQKRTVTNLRKCFANYCNPLEWTYTSDEDSQNWTIEKFEKSNPRLFDVVVRLVLLALAEMDLSREDGPYWFRPLFVGADDESGVWDAMYNSSFREAFHEQILFFGDVVGGGENASPLDFSNAKLTEFIHNAVKTKYVTNFNHTGRRIPRTFAYKPRPGAQFAELLGPELTRDCSLFGEWMTPEGFDQQMEKWMSVPASPIVTPIVSVPVTPATEMDVEELVWVQCDMCDKWRKLPMEVDLDSLPMTWNCSMNEDCAVNSCFIAEEEY
jgi:hypothetical protein